MRAEWEQHSLDILQAERGATDGGEDASTLHLLATSQKLARELQERTAVFSKNFSAAECFVVLLINRTFAFPLSDRQFQ